MTHNKCFAYQPYRRLWTEHKTLVQRDPYSPIHEQMTQINYELGLLLNYSDSRFESVQ